MQINALHRWDLTPKEAVALQRELAGCVIARAPRRRCTLIAGADVSHNRFSSTIFAGVVVLRLPEMTVVERRGATVECHFPYIPGLLSFREAPALLAAFAKVESSPDVVMLDGHGMAHPRRVGLACHVGLWLDRPSLGCAKSLYVGTFEAPGREAGAWSPLTDRGAVVGRVVRTKTGVNPVFVSVGHKMSLGIALQRTMACRGGYRIPEPTRLAHLYVNELRRGEAAI